jgi:predicted secreted protein with PEFG-CTERM motif
MLLHQMRFVIIPIIIFICALTVTNVYADQLGSQQNPYVVYKGWQGSGYYYFSTNNNETGFVSDICQLNSISMKLTGNPLEHPYDPNQIAQCMATVPEFGSFAVAIITISIIGVILFSRKTNIIR